MKREKIIMLVVMILAIVGLGTKNKQIDRLEKRQKDLLLELSEYKWKYDNLKEKCDKVK